MTWHGILGITILIFSVGTVPLVRWGFIALKIWYIISITSFEILFAYFLFKYYGYVIVQNHKKVISIVDPTCLTSPSVVVVAYRGQRSLHLICIAIHTSFRPLYWYSLDAFSGYIILLDLLEENSLLESFSNFKCSGFNGCLAAFTVSPDPLLKLWWLRTWPCSGYRWSIGWWAQKLIGEVKYSLVWTFEIIFLMELFACVSASWTMCFSDEYLCSIDLVASGFNEDNFYITSQLSFMHVFSEFKFFILWFSDEL